MTNEENTAVTWDEDKVVPTPETAEPAAAEEEAKA